MATLRSMSARATGRDGIGWLHLAALVLLLLPSVGRSQEWTCSWIVAKTDSCQFSASYGGWFCGSAGFQPSCVNNNYGSAIPAQPNVTLQWIQTASGGMYDVSFWHRRRGSSDPYEYITTVPYADLNWAYNDIIAEFDFDASQLLPPRAEEILAEAWRGYWLQSGDVMYTRDPCLDVRLPKGAYQHTYLAYTADGVESRIALKSEQLPQGLSVDFVPVAGATCSAPTWMGRRLFPRSGTGPIFDVVGNRAYFLIDNNTAPGFYDLEIEYANGALDTLFANIRYMGYEGYNAAGLLRNALTGNVIRGASVTLWRESEYYGWQFKAQAYAGDGTYAFSVTPGLYKIIVNYELGGEQVRGPFMVVSKAAIPYEETLLAPVSDDVLAPHVLEAGPGTASVVDEGVGLAVVELVSGSQANLDVWVASFDLGASVVRVDYTLRNPAVSGSARIACVDQLGNTTEYELHRSAGASATEPPTNGISLSQTGPNPFNPATAFRIELPATDRVVLAIYDVRGGMVRNLVDGVLPSGDTAVTWDGSNAAGAAVPSGVYFARLTGAGGTRTVKVTVAR